MRARLLGLVMALIVTMFAPPLGHAEAAGGQFVCPNGTNWDSVRHVCR